MRWGLRPQDDDETAPARTHSTSAPSTAGPPDPVPVTVATTTRVRPCFRDTNRTKARVSAAVATPGGAARYGGGVTLTGSSSMPPAPPSLRTSTSHQPVLHTEGASRRDFSAPTPWCGMTVVALTTSKIAGNGPGGPAGRHLGTGGATSYQAHRRIKPPASAGRQQQRRRQEGPSERPADGCLRPAEASTSPARRDRRHVVGQLPRSSPRCVRPAADNNSPRALRPVAVGTLSGRTLDSLSISCWPMAERRLTYPVGTSRLRTYADPHRRRDTMLRCWSPPLHGGVGSCCARRHRPRSGWQRSALPPDPPSPGRPAGGALRPWRTAGPGRYARPAFCSLC